MSWGSLIIEGRIGAGGFGTVYRAVDPNGRHVAVKMIERGSLLSDPEVLERVRRELSISAGLDHPGIVATHGSVETEDGRLGIVMDLLEGPTLREVARPVESQRVVRWSIDICDALQYLADRSIARIDLKPSNVILVDNRPIIIDLGIAKSLTDPAISSPSVSIGTPAYMAPEQLDNRPIDIRTDIFSLGLIMFELLGGDRIRPELKSVPANVYRTLSEDLPVDRLEAPPALRKIVRTATQREPAARFESPAAMRKALEAYIDKPALAPTDPDGPAW